MAILVIGAGASGIAMARQLANCGMEFVCVERRPDIGGLWCYARTAQEALPVDGLTFDAMGANPMYFDLTTNLSKVAMAFHDAPFNEDVLDLPNLPRTEVLRYLQDYAKKHDLRKRMEFDTMVQYVSKARSGVDGKWEVKTCRRDGTERVRHFDHVVVASGHHAKPIVPDLEVDSEYRGRIMHSCMFDKSTDFDGQRVLIIGGSVSAGDLAMMLLRKGKPASVSISRRRPAQTTFRLLTAGGVETAGKNGATLHGHLVKVDAAGNAHFADGSTCGADVIVAATGYAYHFPFLDSSEVDVLESDGLNVRNVYKALFYTKDPSMSFVGLQNVLLGPNQVFEAQARLVLKVIRDGAVASLPSFEDMDKEDKARRAARLPGDREFLGARTKGYIAEVCRVAGVHSTYKGMTAPRKGNTSANSPSDVVPDKFAAKL